MFANVIRDGYLAHMTITSLPAAYEVRRKTLFIVRLRYQLVSVGGCLPARLLVRWLLFFFRQQEFFFSPTVVVPVFFHIVGMPVLPQFAFHLPGVSSLTAFRREILVVFVVWVCT